MTYRSMEKTNADKMKNIEQSNPENNQPQSIFGSVYNKSPLDYAEKNNEDNIKPGMRGK